jgi:type IV secretion system protein TrbE
MTLNLKELFSSYHESADAVGQLVPWYEQITPELVLNQDGSFLAGFSYQGIDYESTNENDHDGANLSLEIALGAFDDRNVLWSYLDKRRRTFVKKSVIPHPVANFVEDEWNDFIDDGNLSEFGHYIFVAFRPFGGTGGFFDEIGALMSDKRLNMFEAMFQAARSGLMFKSGIEKLDGKIQSGIIAFEDQLAKFTQVLPLLNIRRLKGNELLAELSNRINVATPRDNVICPDWGPTYLNNMLPTDTIIRADGGLLKFVGASEEKFVSMLSIKGSPAEISNQHLEQLLMVNGEFSVVQVYRFLDRENAKSYVMKAEQNYRGQVKSPLVQMVEKVTGVESDRVDTGQLVLAEDAQAALREITAENVNFGYHSMSVQVIGNNVPDLDKTRKLISGVLSNFGYGVVREVIHQVGAFMSVIPGAHDASVRSTLISTRNLADLSIVRSLDPGPAFNAYLTEQRGTKSEPLCIFPTQSGVPERFNLHVGDVGHFMVIGPNSGGKTTFVNLLITQWQRYAPCRVIVLDKDKSCYLTINALGGKYLGLSSEDGATGRMSPLRWIDNPARWGEIATWTLGAMSAFGGPEITARQAELVTNSIAMLSSRSGHQKVTLSDLKLMIDGQDKEFGARLSPWVRSTHGVSANYGHIFDNDTDGFSDLLKAGGGVVGIDLGGLLRDERLAPSVLEYLFMSIDDLIDGTTPTLIYLEEAWYLLSNDRFRAGFENWIKTMRKKMVCVGLSTQSVEDVKRSGISSTLNDNIKTRIFLPNIQALASSDVYIDLLGLTLDHVDKIRTLTPKRDYMIWQEGRTRIVDGFLPKSVLALTRGDALARNTFEKWRKTEDPNFLNSYVKEMVNA